MKIITEPASSIKVVDEVDICIIGGSCTGVFAAVRAARLGAKVAIIEKQNCFGGTATAGMVNVWHSLYDIDKKEQVIAGLTQEVIERLQLVEGVSCDEKRGAYRLDTELLKIELDQLILDNSINCYLHTMYCAPYVKHDELLGVIIQNKDGRQAILSKFFIDASGDGDLAFHLGLDSYKHDNIQPPTPCYKLIGDISGVHIEKLLQDHGAEFGLPEDWGWGGSIPSIPNLHFRADTHVFNVDCSKAEDLTYAEIEGRRQMKAIINILRKYAPNGKELRIAGMCSNIGIRETRHFESDYKMNQHDLINGVSFDDAIGYGTYPIDIHHANESGITFRHLDGREIVRKDRMSPAVENMWREGDDYARYYQIPFRTLVQRKVPNLITAGRMINADSDAFGAVRVMVNMNQVGEAAGVAAYIATSSAKKVWDIDINQVRNMLKKGGTIIL